MRYALCDFQSGLVSPSKPLLETMFCSKRYLIQKCFVTVVYYIHILSGSRRCSVSLFQGYCNPSVNAIESWMGDGRSYIFKGDRFWRLNDYANETDRSYPKTISSNWIGVPDDIDEIFLWGHNWKTYFFKGDQYYRYHDVLKKVDSGYPKKISEGWPGLPSDGIDAGFTYSTTESYFFKGDKVYKFDGVNDQVDAHYSNGKFISDVWPGLPNNIDSAFRWYWDGESYFFKGDSYYKWNATANIADGPFLIGDNAFKNICDV